MRVGWKKAFQRKGRIRLLNRLVGSMIEGHCWERLSKAQQLLDSCLSYCISSRTLVSSVSLYAHLNDILLMENSSESSKSKGNNAQETTRNGQILNLNGSKSSSTKQQTRRGGNGRYPTENIKF